MLYQCLTRYKGSDSSEISLNKNDIVKVLDKKDHGMSTPTTSNDDALGLYNSHSHYLFLHV